MGLIALMLSSAAIYLIGLTQSGYGNEFYAATVRAGSKNWTAMLFGSLDSANGITVDKPPAAYWIPALFARVFGFSSLTVLLPQALMGIATVWFTYVTVARLRSRATGLLAGTLMLLTPVAVMMFRFNNPDAMLTLCLSIAAYFTVRALRSTSARRFATDWWILGAGLILGLAFLVKMLQGFLTIPTLVLVVLIAGSGGIWRRLRHVGVAAVGVIAPIAAYAAVFYAWPVDKRPYMAGTDTNSFFELVFGYNGFGRIFGGSGNGGGGGGGGGMGGGGFGGSTGVLRLLNSSFGPEIGWLLPASLLLLIAGLWVTRRAPRTDLTRAGLIIFGGWTLITAAVFSFMEGTIHPYYVVALAPGAATTVALGAAVVWQARETLFARIAMSVTLATTTATAYYYLATAASDWLPWLRWVILAVGLLTSVALLVGVDRVRTRSGRSLATVVLIAAIVSGALGSASWALASVGNSYNGSIPSSGPVAASGMNGMGGGGMGGSGGPGGQSQSSTTTDASSSDSSSSSSNSSSSGESSSSSTTDSTASSDSSAQDSSQGSAGGGGGMSGQASSELTTLLSKTTTTYSAAMTGASSAASLMVASDTDVLDIGGWMGSDPYPTLAQFQTMVKNGEITYYISGGQGGGPGGSDSSTASAIATWVQENYTATTVGSSTVYDLTAS